MRLIVCAANKYPSGRIVLGVRHFDSLMHSVLRDSDFISPGRFEVQGFVDNKGEFLTRTEAWQVALEAGQIMRRCGGDTAEGGTLYSENLY